ncbi:Calx-beta domain-containing protein, partial [Microcoleus sp. T3B2]|uniref:Calx-beta domain-containing protein n=1 Tax=Microcoleus sp. T3B2 TaxID=3055426 RepID=UPI002FCEFFB2
VVTLSEAVQKGTGNLVIKKVSDNSIVETINVTAANVTVSGSSVTINPVNDLVDGTQYYVEIANGAIKDLAGNNYAGITGATTWNFKTVSAISITDIEVDESATNATFTVSLSSANSEPITVSYQTVDVSARVADGDYTALTKSTLTFAPGEQVKTISVPIVNDSVYEPNTEIFTVNLSDPKNAVIGKSRGIATINSDDGAPWASIVVYNQIVNIQEGNSGTSTVTIPISLDRPSNVPVKVSYKTVDDTATVADNDYVQISPTVVTFNRGEIKKDITVSVVGDRNKEKNEWVNVVISAVDNNVFVPSYSNSQSFRIEDDDIEPNISINDITLKEGNGDGNNNTFSSQATFTVTLSEAAGIPVTVQYQTNDGIDPYDPNGFRLEVVDYQNIQQTALTFQPGETSKTITVPINGDSYFEKDEQFIVTLSDAVGGKIVKGTGIATVINDDAKPTISIIDATTSEIAGRAEVEVKLSSPSSQAVRVGYRTQDNTAKANEDYTKQDLTNVLFKPGETVKTIPVPIVKDNKTESGEFFSVILSEPSVGSLNSTIAKGTGTITILDQIGISIDDIQVIEGNSGQTNATFTVTLTAPVNVPVTVEYNTQDGTAKRDIYSNDYYGSGRDNKITFASGETKKTITLPIIGDTKREEDETFSVILSNPTNAVLSSKSTGIATIIDDDRPLVSISDTIVDEDGGKLNPAKFDITLSKPVDEKVTVTYSTKDGTAKSGDKDYSAVINKTVIFNPNETKKTIDVEVVGDSKVEGDETFSVVLNSVNSSNNSKISVGEAAAIIDDFNDSTKSYPNGAKQKIFIDRAVVLEGEKSATNEAVFNVKLDSASTLPITVRYRTEDDTATVADKDYEPITTPQTLTFNPGETQKTIRVKVNPDEKAETDERFKVLFRGATNATVENIFAEGIIIDNKLTKAGITQLAFDMLAACAVDTGNKVQVPFFGQFPTATLESKLSTVGKSLTGVLNQNPNIARDSLKQVLSTALPTGFSLVDDESLIVNPNSLEFKIRGQESFNSQIGSKGFNLFDRIQFNQDTYKLGEPSASAGQTSVDYDISVAVAYKSDLGWYINTQKTGFSTVINEKVKDGSLINNAISGFLPVNFTAKTKDNKTSQSQANFQLSLRDFDGSETDADGFGLTASEIVNNLYNSFGKIGTSQPLYNSALTADGTLNLDGEVLLKSGLPSLKFNLYSDLPTINYVNGKLTTEKNPSFLAINNVKLDLGNFISRFAKPVFGNISRVISPIRPILDFLNTDTKIFGEVGLIGAFDADKDGKVTPLDLLKKFAGDRVYQYVKFVDTVNEIDKITRLMEESLKESGNLELDLAPYQLYKDEEKEDTGVLKFSPESDDLKKRYEEYKKAEEQRKQIQKTATKDEMTKQTQVAGEGVNSQVKKKGDSRTTKKEELASKLAGAFESFDLPILTNSQSAGKLLAGEDVPLMTYQLPALEFGPEIEAGFRVFGVLEGGLRGSLKANLRSIPIGYDTYGMKEWVKTGKDLDLLNGFYMSTNKNADGTGENVPELILKATIGAFAELDALVASAGVEGGIEGTAELNLIEPEGSPKDGKLRAGDLANIFTAPQDIINLQGGIRAYFDAYYDTAVTSEERIRLGSFPIYNFRVGAESGTAQDGYITGAWVFFDANFNNIQDEGESNSMTFPDGSFELQVDMDKFDINKNGKLDPTEGKVVLISGQDISTGLTLDTPLSSVHGSKMVTPLTTIVAQLAQEGMDVTEAQTKVKAALGLPADIDLATFNPLEAVANNDPKGLALYAAAIQVQNTIVQTAKFIDGVSKVSLAQLADAPIAAIALSLKGGASVDLAKIETIQAIVESSITKAAASDSTINISQLKSVASAAAQIMALGNQIIKDLVASGRPLKDIALEITKLQAVSVGQIAVGLPDLAAGTVTVEQFLAQNTKEAILGRMEKVKVNDPTVRPVVETSALKDPIDPEEPTSEDTGSAP